MIFFLLYLALLFSFILVIDENFVIGLVFRLIIQLKAGESTTISRTSWYNPLFDMNATLAIKPIYA